ncbi:hypothetical protein ACE01N_09050 [Saccharicrinis sp. FJH2]|uniref:hypothetical protein n=1 Tax=Saccharicrinis sp. FJH65 TaxID=3344659 RepID=UPI0035F3BD12
MKQLIAILCIIIPSILKSQTLNDFKYFDKQYAYDSYLLITPAYALLWNSEAPNANAHRLNGFTGKLDMRKINYGTGERRYLYQHKLLFDLLLILNNQINGDGSAYYRQESSGLTTGILGWLSLGWNVVSTDRFCMAFGGNINDYFLTSSYRFDPESNNLTTIEPQGYWFAGGPSAFFDYLINSNFLIQAHASYSLGFWRAAKLEYGGTQIDDNYPNPHFAGLNLELQSRWGFITGIDYNFLLNRGDNPNNTQRLELMIGFRFPI